MSPRPPIRDGQRHRMTRPRDAARWLCAIWTLGIATASVSAQTFLPAQSFFGEHEVLAAHGNWLVTGDSFELAIYAWSGTDAEWQPVLRDLTVAPRKVATDGEVVAVLDDLGEVHFYRLGNGKVVLETPSLSLDFGADVLDLELDGVLVVALEDSISLSREIEIYEAPSGSSAPSLLESFGPPIECDCPTDFGTSLTVQNDVIVIGAACTGLTGEVHVYGRTEGTNDWFHAQKLVALDNEVNNKFGAAVALDGSWLAVGAPRNDVFDKFENIPNAGSVRLYRAGFFGFFELKDSLVRSGFSTDDFFGTSVALLGDLLIAGAPGDDIPGLTFDFSDVGTVEVHARSGDLWPHLARLRPGSPVERIGAALGEQVALTPHGPVATAPGDLFAFAFDDPTALFADGFESGNMGAWSSATP